MNKLNVLIVEDELRIAELHSQFIQQIPGFHTIGIARTIKEAVQLIGTLKPSLILLDNYLPDGQGIDLMHSLKANKLSPDIVFLTAANDLETVKDAMRCGTFDYLIKPIACDRLQNTFQRYLRYRNTMRHAVTVNQRYVDEMFSFQANEGLCRCQPKGIDEFTLDKVKEAFSNPDICHTAESLGNLIGISKTTARRYLEHCAALTYLHAEVIHGKVGRPERVYRKLDSLLN